jgi:hypothetical protein
MKKGMTFIGALLFASTILMSCRGSSNSEESSEAKISLPDPPSDIKYASVQLIDGPLSNYVEVVPGEYALELEKSEEKYLLGYKGQMKVKFKFLKSIEIKEGQGYNYYGPSLLGKALDEQGAPLEFEIDATTDKDLATYLKRGSGEEWLTLEVFAGTCQNAEEASKQLENFKKGKKVRFNSEIVEEKFGSESSSSNSGSSEDNKSSSSSGDCDEFLEGYEKFMVEYIAVLKKYKNNPTDASILSEYTSVMSKASEWSSKTSDCASDSKFASKFSEIQMKIANAASGI